MAPKKTTFKKELPLADRAGEAPLLRQIPQNTDAERGLLGSIFVDPARVIDLCMSRGIVAEAFLDPAHRCIYTAVEALAGKGQPVDTITVGNYLTNINQLESVGGIETFATLISRTPTSAHAGFYADIVMEQYIRRRLLGTIRQIEESVFDSSIASGLLLSSAEESILQVNGSSKTQGSVADWKGSVEETMATLRRQLDNPAALSGLSTGFQHLDQMMRGMHPGEMIVLAARPSMGKTSLAMNIAECCARGRDIFGRPFKEADGQFHKHGVLIFSLEMTQVQLTTRMLCGMAKVSAHEIESGTIKKQVALPALEAAAREMATVPIRCDDQSGLDVLEMRARARHICKKEKIELIVIDYLQLLNHREYAKQGRQIETSKISGEVKAMAKELNVPVIILSQLSRAPEQRSGSDEKPKSSDLRDSGAIEQDADVILLLRRPCRMARSEEREDKELAIVDVAKNRNGPVGEVRLNFKDSLTRFSDRTESMNSDGDYVPVDLPPSP